MMKQIYLLPLCLLCTCVVSQAQKSYTITFIDSIRTLPLERWSRIPDANTFTTSLPQFGQIPAQPTTVKLAYSSDGILVKAVCYSDKIRSDGSTRDVAGTADYFSVALDTWNDDQNAFVFTITASGQLIDSRKSSLYSETGFDAPWKATVNCTATSWEADIWIPFTALRFSPGKEQIWGMQFTRFDRNNGELSTWSPQDPLVQDEVLQYGTLYGLGRIRQKKRLGISLLASADNWPKAGVSADAQIGLNSATTLSFNLLPDIFPLFYVRPYLVEQSRFDRILSNGVPVLPVPRQLYTEENAVFRKTGLSDNPKWGSIPRPVLTTFAGKSASGTYFWQSDLRELQYTKFTTRTRSNWTIGVANALANRPHYIGFNPFYEFKKYPYRVNYSVITAEKAFRNNSWLQCSNGILHLSEKFNVYSNNAAIQLRDASNRFAVNGTFKMKTEQSGKNIIMKGGGDIRLAQINSQWNKFAAYEQVFEEGNSIFPFGLTTRMSPYSRSISVGSTLQNFSPAQKRWLNISQTFGYNH